MRAWRVCSDRVRPCRCVRRPYWRNSRTAFVRRSAGRLSLEQYVQGVLNDDRTILARAITVVESDRHDDFELSGQLLDGILPHTGGSRRVGITGVPGAGKSTFIDALGMQLIHDRSERVAVLSVDPASPVSGGSIL